MQKTLRTVFLIMMENHNWSDIKQNSSAPYINQTLLPVSSYAEQYYNPPGIHPSEPNYLWLEAGTNFGVTTDDEPSVNHQHSTQHLVTLLDQAGISWKSYQEDIDGTVCPIQSSGLYATNSSYCIAHVRPFSELATDLQNNTQARYNFITPNLCNDMHNTCSPLNDSVLQGDTWLSQHIPVILNSQAYQNSGIVFITWDEGEGVIPIMTSDGPIGLILLSSLAKGNGYSNTIHYTHSSTLRTIQEIFGVTPLLGDAANATNLSDLFLTYP
jgi:phospholipase C